MTYNFDPDKWYDNELFSIQAKLNNREINTEEYEKAVEILDKNLADMWQRLDGSYQIGKTESKTPIPLKGKHSD